MANITCIAKIIKSLIMHIKHHSRDDYNGEASGCLEQMVCPFKETTHICIINI